MAEEIVAWDFAKKLMDDGEILAEHAGGRDREYCGIVGGRPWLYPGEVVIEFNGEIFVVTKPTVEGPYKRDQ